MPLIGNIMRRERIRYFLESLPKDARILEVGCGAKWVGEYLRGNGWQHYVGLDLYPPADIVGDINRWRELGLEAASFDVIVAFEVIEHVECFRDCYDLLKPGGQLLVTTPIPHMDWAMKILEGVGLNQKRTSPHSNLTYLDRVPDFEMLHLKRKSGLAQWAILRKPVGTAQP